MSSKSKKKNKNKSTSIRSKFEKNNPLTQTNLLVKNTNLTHKHILEIKENIQTILKILFPLLDKISLHEYPCEISKYITDKICLLSDNFNPTIISDTFSFDNLKTLSQKSLNHTLNLKNSLNEPNLFSKHLSNLTRDTSEMNQQIMKDSNNLLPATQKGGFYDPYEYIIDPNTNKLINTNSKPGRAIVLSYIKN